MSDDHPAPTGSEQEIPPHDIDPVGRADGVDDHRITPHPTGLGHQPTGGLDEGVDIENLNSPSQGVKVEAAPDPQRDAPPEG